jgi:hypothetical protein
MTTDLAPLMAQAAAVDDFYRSFASVSFTLLGLWWVVVNLRYKSGEGDRERRRHAYGVAMFFLLPGVGSLLSSINTELTALWRVAFGLSAVVGLAEVVLYLRSGARRTQAAVALRVCGAVLYVLMLVLAVRPKLTADLALGLTGPEAEAILLAGLLLVGANLAWLGLTEAEETAGA